MPVDTPWYEDVGRFLTGQADPNTLEGLRNGVQGPSQSAYQIPGMQDYVNGSGGRSSEVGGLNVDLGAATQGARGQQSTLQDYFMRIAQGQGETGADKLLQNAQGSANRNLQSASVSAGGNNPALALRQMLGAQSAVQGDIAGKSAAQKLQEQQQYGNMAANQGAQMYQQDFQRAQQDYANKMSNVQARQDIANGIFSAQRSQTSLNADYDKSRMAFENWKYEAAKQAEQDRARAAAVLPQLAIKGGLVAGASALGGPAGGMAAGAAVDAGVSEFGAQNGGGDTGSFQDPALRSRGNPYGNNASGGNVGFA